MDTARACWAERNAISERMAQAHPAIEEREAARRTQLVEALGLRPAAARGGG